MFQEFQLLVSPIFSANWACSEVSSPELLFVFLGRVACVFLTILFDNLNVYMRRLCVKLVSKSLVVVSELVTGDTDWEALTGVGSLES